MKAVIFAFFTCSAVEAASSSLRGVSPSLRLSSGTSIDGIIAARNIGGVFCKEQEAI